MTVSIAHTWVSDLTLVLRSPNGTHVELSSDNGGAGDNYTNTVFDQDADDPITGGVTSIYRQLYSGRRSIRF